MGDSDGDEDGGGVDGDDSRGNSPSRQGAGTKTSVPRNGVSRWRRRPWSLSGVSSIDVGFLRREGFYRRRGGARGCLGSPHHTWVCAPLGRAALWSGGPGLPLRLPFGVLVRLGEI